MAKKQSGTPSRLVIVESPAKARTISRFLGPEYRIEASIGHIRDLPEGAKECPPEYRGQQWAYLGVNVNNDFEPIYVVPKEKKKQVAKLRDAIKNVSELLLATDEDREGEAISWHLCQVLQPRVPVRRLVFHEITQRAILRALESPREIDENLVRAQEARRILDRLFGYEVSPLLWRKLRRGLSAGRVQSVAVRLIVDRERRRMSFVRAGYWDIAAVLATASGESFPAVSASVDGRRIVSGRDFDPTTGKLKVAEDAQTSSVILLDEEAARSVAERVRRAVWKVLQVEEKPYVTRPYPPFTTSTLQQEANRKFGYTARTTMQIAQRLYENGYITYMRTDSTSLSQEAVAAARQTIRSLYGEEYLSSSPRIYATKVKNAQEAHEAIRPAGTELRLPESLRGELSPEELRLYDLIWKRTVACQMSDARGRRVSAQIDADGVVFQASGKTIEFPGYLRVYVEGADDPEAELADRETVLPPLRPGQQLTPLEVTPNGHVTQPPPRYTEAALTRALEEMGIGRPSTYASIIDTILERRYVFKRANALVPTWTAVTVVQLMERHLPSLIDYLFTAEMEDALDAISRGELRWVDYLRRFYFGNDRPGLKPLLASKVEEIDAREASRVFIGRPPGASEDDPGIWVRVGKYGPFLEYGERRGSIPDDLPPDELTPEKALELLGRAEMAEQPLCFCSETGKPIYVKTGRYGPYVQRGEGGGEQKPEYVSLPKKMRPEDVTPDIAMKLLSLPRTLGTHPQSGEPVVAQLGRYGPYLQCGSETRSIPEDLSVLDITLEQALELLAQPKGTRRRRIEALRELGISPVTGQPVKLMSGRYGPYVTDGVTNCSLPKSVPPDEVTLESALPWLAEKAAAGGSRGGRRKTAKKAAGGGSAARKSVKKTAVKKTARKTAAKRSSKRAEGT
ncbi:MAG: type I DNA topoisomerase [Thermogutta sp.]